MHRLPSPVIRLNDLRNIHLGLPQPAAFLPLKNELGSFRVEIGQSTPVDPVPSYC